MHFMTAKKSRTRFNDNAFTAVKKGSKGLNHSRYVKGLPFVNREYAKIFFLSKMVYKRVLWGWTLGRSHPA